MPNLIKCLLLTIVFLIPPLHSIAADEQEITQLLDFVKQSGCIFIRNGKEHTAVDASAHLKMKYLKVKKRVKDAEKFIQYIASRSSITKKPYQVQCGQVVITSERWLLEELERIRQTVAESPGQ